MITIWGIADYKQELAEGVYEVGTPTHGGIVVEERVADKYLSKSAQEESTFEFGLFHFEEDAEWAIFAKENPTLFSKKELRYVDYYINTYFSHYLDNYKQEQNEKLCQK